MPREDLIALTGTVVEMLGRGLCRVELRNGHRLLAHPARRDREWAGRLQLGETVNVEISPFDFSAGRLVAGEHEQRIQKDLK